MTYQFPPDVDRLIKQQMALGGYASEDEVLRHALAVLGQFAYSPEEIDEEYRQSLSAIRDGLADMEAGRMRPLREIIRDARDKATDENA
jgi:Arc/MetJ-type ribon-helix-helix transcriptional regulator